MSSGSGCRRPAPDRRGAGSAPAPVCTAHVLPTVYWLRQAQGPGAELHLDRPFKNARLRYISTGHGGWTNGDEFVPKKNTILLNGKEVFSFVPWRQDCGAFRLFNPASGNFNDGLSSSDISRSNWCPGTATNPIYIDLGHLKAGQHRMTVRIPQGPREGTSFSSWNVSGVLVGE
ncbi:hypothetical protein C1O66_12570 [Paucibacter aquatile]|uniref:Peptide-N-glycosidase F C-terminal domain-containing protein n=1 Tax=Kinneretia aquatilis TaxID=2070761 RepID=A0A2N8KXT1_9BURK|nr:hypothetical protein C1O66_12570 [Paucibacter aquatile]